LDNCSISLSDRALVAVLLEHCSFALFVFVFSQTNVEIVLDKTKRSRKVIIPQSKQLRLESRFEILTDDLLQRLRTRFRKFDENDSGRLEKVEMVKLVQECIKAQNTAQYLTQDIQRDVIFSIMCLINFNTDEEDKFEATFEDFVEAIDKAHKDILLRPLSANFFHNLTISPLGSGFSQICE